ncbi:EAL domain-containing protein [Rhizobium sp. CG5]|uniref:EAL domain-containing protein n=1 Tax=Rhizobium sp. CG5 TaxID=2726076 RepID=UPI0020349EBE|nr:EAL domain-containing protein [Rhizobium sp. CG5]MCM2476098.1 EAL domain-containing protein [Rhizobium sp. CG5]
MTIRSKLSIVIENLPSIAMAYSEGVAGRVLRAVWGSLGAALESGAWFCEDEAWGVSLRSRGDMSYDLGLEEVEAAVRSVSLAPVKIGSLQIVVALGFREGEISESRASWPVLEIAQYRFDMSAATLAYSAIAAGGITFAEQPIVSSVDQNEEFYRECLIRLPDGNGGHIMPGVYLPALERLGLTRAFDRFVVRETIMQLRRRPDLALGCNISALSTKADIWWHSILTDLRRDPELARRLVIEVTETALLPDGKEALEFVSAFKATGCRIALDDFGAGLSLVAFARSARPDIIKIDSIYVRDAAEFMAGMELLSSLVVMSSCLASQVVIEGIEDEQGLSAARATGARWLQGYLLGRPSVPADRGVRHIQAQLTGAMATTTGLGGPDEVVGGMGMV